MKNSIIALFFITNIVFAKETILDKNLEQYQSETTFSTLLCSIKYKNELYAIQAGNVVEEKDSLHGCVTEKKATANALIKKILSNKKI